MILMDAGPLVAILHADDRHHEACTAALRSIREPLVTVWPALTEAAFLLEFSWAARDARWDLLDGERLRVADLGVTDVPRIRELMRKYRDLPMDLADAALVAVAERERIRTVFTVDRRDFGLYRPARVGRFQIIP
jgi:hypothetical protein